MEVAEDKRLGPYEDSEIIDLTQKLRAKGLPFFVTDETGVVVVDDTAIRTSRFE
jgi:hypothetical protein